MASLIFSVKLFSRALFDVYLSFKETVPVYFLIILIIVKTGGFSIRKAVSLFEFAAKSKRNCGI